ncbi:hypothetical protein [Marinobacter sp. M-5]|uniref:hypothetical protein n=1 Tax=Marinobacter sp. M-5 TaxID=3081089 RepID=UPI00293C85F2|nr:hypothetical protein [Marinobacter sp. M-5]MDV3504697.1 hypothetical protein [Marinobacter sp. M-5]
MRNRARFGFHIGREAYRAKAITIPCFGYPPIYRHEVTVMLIINTKLADRVMTKKKLLFSLIPASTALTGCAPTQMVSMNNGMTGGTMATVSHVELTEISMNDQAMVSGQRQTCLQSGAIGENRACASTALPAIASKAMSDEALENIVRRDNLGAFVSPYTSDGVLAEWVNVGTNANIGSTVGSGVGAAAGSMIAGQLLDSVPGASLLGGFFGSQVGKDTGRDAAIAAYGGLWRLGSHTCLI